MQNQTSTQLNAVVIYQIKAFYYAIQINCKKIFFFRHRKLAN